MPERRSAERPGADGPDGKEASGGAPSEEAIAAFLAGEGFRWLDIPNIVGVSVSEKEQGGKPCGPLSVKFDVVAKLAGDAEIVTAGSRPIPAVIEIDGHPLPTDVVQGWPEPHDGAVQRKARLDPVCGGISVGNRGETGTLGAVLWHKTSAQPVALSNWHVLNNRESDPVATMQPGPNDDPAVGRNALGQLLGSGILDATLDAAISTIDRRRVSGTIAELGVGVGRVAAPEPGMRVVKSGKATAVTHGIVGDRPKLVSLNISSLPMRHKITVWIIGPDPSRPSAGPLSSVGDSGSCWMKCAPDGRATDTMVGLHVGGDGNSLAYACPADLVFSRLGLEPLGTHSLAAPSPPPPPPGPAGAEPALYRVMARDGLLIRTGPGLEFPEKGGLAFGAEVSVISRHGDWLAVDLQGDGAADGFMHGSLLQPLDPS